MEIKKENLYVTHITEFAYIMSFYAAKPQLAYIIISYAVNINTLAHINQLSVIKLTQLLLSQ